MMIINLANEIQTIQRSQVPATTRPTTNTQNPTTNRDVQDAARELREAIRANIDQELIAAKAQAVAQAAEAQARAQGAPPAPIPPNRQITIHGRDGNTVIGVPAGIGRDVIPPEFVDISIAFFFTIAAIIIGLPLARAFARRMDRRGGTAPMSNEIASQLTHLNQAVDAIALEVERISENQRFTTRLLSEQREAARQTLPSGVER
jgi:hypothetical protein